MRIILLECKKALSSPIILALLLLFSAWNVFLVYDSSDFKEELGVVNQIAKKYGTQITDESLLKLEDDLQPGLSHLNSVTQKKSGQTFEHASDFFAQLNYENQELFTSKELQSFYELHLKEMYVGMAKSFDPTYAKFNINKMGEEAINGSRLSGTAAEMLRNEYTKFATRFEELKKNKEYMHWFFAGKPYAMHSLLFRTLFITVLIEAMILVVLSTALITNFEFENRTQLVTYTARRGRKLMLDKFIASLITTSIITLFLLIITLASFFMAFDYSYLWKTVISSGFNWDYNFPYVPWWDFSFLTYLLLAIIISYICMLLFSTFTFSLSVMLKNSYFTFILFAVIFIALFILPAFIPGSLQLKILAGFNLSSLVLNPHQWWMGTGGLTMFKYYEVSTILAWTVIFAICCYVALKKFAKLDIS
ncbi:hypothetical protein ACFFF5_08955 [Lederbergia wuyishanensis]|uniref:ABC transporter n=1 Tax=Lederbergia wuyishanensis TaxID=1347903 RepID=A0ABU0D605_9BACI|nr:hypothetical protein [Lederbergia wuyishanensis]MCJ8008731.1 hypothetical protein [Lederbergia wuyishanensis]MDQ0343848.1 hypothetical protein [Lederbergia wuyishanensis]